MTGSGGATPHIAMSPIAHECVYLIVAGETFLEFPLQKIRLGAQDRLGVLHDALDLLARIFFVGIVNAHVDPGELVGFTRVKATRRSVGAENCVGGFFELRLLGIELVNLATLSRRRLCDHTRPSRAERSSPILPNVWLKYE